MTELALIAMLVALGVLWTVALCIGVLIADDLARDLWHHHVERRDRRRAEVYDFEADRPFRDERAAQATVRPAHNVIALPIKKEPPVRLVPPGA